MAARILHRLRDALGGGRGRDLRAGGGGAEDCPESSELEDDTEGLSTRLSGTLSFTSREEEEEEREEEEGGEDGAGEELGQPPPPTGAAPGAEDGGRAGRGGGAPRQRAADPAAAGAVEAVAGRPGTAAAALRGHQRQRGQRAILQVRALHHLPDPLRPLRQGPRRHRPALLGLRAAEPPAALPLRLRHGRRRLPQEEAAPQLRRRDHRQAEPRLRAVPVPPALHRRDPPLARVPRVLLPAGPASRAAPDLHRHVPRGAGRLGQRLPAAGAAGRRRLRPLPPDAGRAGRVPPGAGRAGRGARLLRAGAAAAGGAGQPPAAGPLPAGPRPPGLEGGQGQAALGGPAAGPAGGWAAPAAAAHPQGVPGQGAAGVSAAAGGREGDAAGGDGAGGLHSPGTTAHARELPRKCTVGWSLRPTGHRALTTRRHCRSGGPGAGATGAGPSWHRGRERRGFWQGPRLGPGTSRETRTIKRTLFDEVVAGRGAGRLLHLFSFASPAAPLPGSLGPPQRGGRWLVPLPRCQRWARRCPAPARRRARAEAASDTSAGARGGQGK